MSPGKKPTAKPNSHRVAPAKLRWRCAPDQFPFQTTEDLGACPINIIGQVRALEALRLGLTVASDGYNIFVTGDVGSGRSTVVRRTLGELERGQSSPADLVFVHNFQDHDQPRRLAFPAGRGKAFRDTMEELIESLIRDLPRLFDSEEYRKHRTVMVEAASKQQKNELKEFEKRVQEQGFALVQVQMGPLMRPQLVPVVAGNPVDMDQLEALVEQEQFKREELNQLQKKLTELRGEMEGLGKKFRNLDRELRRQMARLDRELARPLVEEAVGELGESFSAEGLDVYLEQVAEDILEHLDQFRERPDEGEDAQGQPAQMAKGVEAPDSRLRYAVNVLVDNSKTKGRPIIWENTPSYRNLFGTIEKVRTSSGEWATDHTRIKGGSLLRANGGFLVLDAMDVLTEAGVWSALKRTLRTRSVEIQSFDPFYMFSANSLKPESMPIDVKVVMIGTRHIYRLLYNLDEDFKKIFKVKAEFAMHTELNEEELNNFACFVHKKVNDDSLPPFHRDAVAAVVEEAVRLAGMREKLTTRFTKIADVIREAGYWAAAKKARSVRATHVDQALEHRVYRVNLIEELLRERIDDGQVLIDLEGAKVGQINGLAVLDLGDHIFALPSRITATTAMGRAGIIDIDREAAMAGSIHTKGVLILSGFLRSRFAQDHPLALTASLCFEQNYGGVEGDSASSAELYALLSSLSGVPLRQGIAVTGSVNQNGEIQPIGGVNEKIEGFFDLCNLKGLTGDHGVMIPKRNLDNLMLRKDVVKAVRAGKFNVYAVCSIEEGLQVLTGRKAGELGLNGKYPAGTIYTLVADRLRELAEEVRRFGAADVPATS
jgi:ATP-dependent Lon protease